MRKKILIGVSLALLSQLVESGDLNELIKRNVQDAATASEQVLLGVEQSGEPPRLWIHVQREEQRKLGEEILGSVKDVKLGGAAIEEKPIEIVDFGPNQSQLRYFKTQDAQNARDLFDVLHALIPDLQLKDFSRKYSEVTWIKPGHYELWLSRHVERIGVSE